MSEYISGKYLDGEGDMICIHNGSYGTAYDENAIWSITKLPGVLLNNLLNQNTQEHDTCAFLYLHNG